MSDSVAVEEAETPKKKSWLGKVIGWLVMLAVAIVVAKFIAGLRSDQKGNFIKKSRALAETQCQADAECLKRLDVKFEGCLELASDSHKSGKYGRKYELDEPAFLRCVR